MNLVSIFSLLIGLAGLYLGLGFLFAIYFVFRGVGKIDPVAASGSTGFRFLIIPGVCLFWPLLLTRWIRGETEPPDECNNHRVRAGGAP